MKKELLYILFVLLTIFMVACNGQADTVSVDDLIDGEIKDDTTVVVRGEAAFISEANKENINTSLEGPTQIIKVVDEKGKGLDVYNEIEVTGKEVKRDEKITVKGIYHDIEDTTSPVIQAKKIDK